MSRPSQSSKVERRGAHGRRREDALENVIVQDAFAALTDGVIITDEADLILGANPAAFRLLGGGDLVGRRFNDLLLVRRATTAQRTDERLVRRAWFRQDDRSAVVEIVSTAMPGRVPAPRTIHTLRDITAQAELLRLKEEFMLQVAHELRTPIAALVASLDLLTEDALSMPRQELSAMCGTLQRSATRLANLVENLLDAGSIEAGTLHVRAAPTSLSRAVQESLAVVQSLCDVKRQTITTDLGEGTDRVVADPRRTAQVISNLVANASKYAPEATAIAIRTTVVDGYVRLTVRDAGPGIPEDEQPRLFQPFFRSRLVRDEAGGLGLGLAICRAIVQAQGGDIWIESTPGEGTTVHFTVPKARDLPEEADPGS